MTLRLALALGKVDLAISRMRTFSSAQDQLNDCTRISKLDGSFV